MFAYPRIAERLFGRAHAIEPGALRTIMEGKLLRRVLAGEQKHDDDAIVKSRADRRIRLSAAVDGETVVVDDGCEYALTRDGIAVVPVFGVLAQRFDFLAAICGWATYEGIIAVCDAMANDYRVRGILFDIESPGGEVSGMLDAADAIIELGNLKPVWSIANAYAYSAAYALAGSAETLVIPRMADVGSIGAVAVHIDESTADSAQGLSYTAIYSGARKIDGWGHAPLNDASRQVIQDRVDYARQEFAVLVGRQDRITSEQAMETEAAIYTDQAAVDAGLADIIGNFDQALAQLTMLANGESLDNSSIGARAPFIPTTEKIAMANPKTAAQVAQEADTQAKIDAAVVAAKSEAHAAGKAEGLAEAKIAADIAAAAQPKEQPKQEPKSIESSAYTLEMAGQVTEICALAGLSALDAKKHIDAKTPPDKVRAALIKDRADRATADAELNATTKQASATAGWDEVVAKVNKEFGISANA